MKGDGFLDRPKNDEAKMGIARRAGFGPGGPIGLRALKLFLDYAETRNLQSEGPVVEDTESPFEFKVLDADGTDGKALFQLPDPGDVIDPITGEYDPDAADYLVFIKVLSPKGKAKMTTGVWTDPEGNIWVVSEEALYLNQPKPAGKEGKSINKGNQFEDVTKELTTILYDFDGDGTAERIEIFDPAYQYCFWDYDNNGLKHVQLRFYKLVDINKMPAA